MMRKKKMRKEKKKKWEREKRENKNKNVSMSKNKKNELPGSLKCIRNFKVSRLKDPFSFFIHVQFDNEDFLCALGSLFSICTCPPILSVCICLFSLLDITYFPMNFLTSLSKTTRILSCYDNISFIISW
jgi:hypothetical protein